MPANWQQITAPGATFPGAPGVAGGGFNYGIQFRDSLDAKRSMMGRTPEAEYPDGYLGTITNRQQDKVLGKIQQRLNDRSYQRGVHVGSKIGRKQYYWDDTINPEAGLARQAATCTAGRYTLDCARYTQAGNPIERLVHMGKTAGLTPPEEMEVARKFGVNPGMNPVVVPDPTRQAKLRKMLPSYV